MPQSKYKREQAAKDDKCQSLLNPTNISKPELRKTTISTFTSAHTGVYRCPFCLHEGKIERFLISTSKGYHRGLGKCPECGNQMQLKTLTAKWTPEQFAEFAYGYRVDGYWQKVKFSVFNTRLHALGISLRFWKRYKELKGEEPTEGYEQWLMRKQQEEYEKQELPDE